MRKVFTISIIVVALCCGPSAPHAIGATQTLEISKSTILGRTQFFLSFSISGARMTIRRINDDDIVVRAAITYNTTALESREPKLRMESSGTALRAEFTSGRRALPYTNTNIEEWDIAVGNYDVDTELNLACSNLSADLQLGGLPLTRCSMKFRQAIVALDFDAPTTRPVAQFTINGHALNLSLSNLGNTDFNFFNLTGSGGTVDLNFDGLYSVNQHNVQIASSGMIQQFIVPSDAGEQVIIFPFSLPIVVVPGDEWTRDFRMPFVQRFTTNDYNTKTIKINFGITAIGSFSMIVREPD